MSANDSCYRLCRWLLPALLCTAMGQDVDELEIDVPRPLGGRVELKLSNQVEQLELSLDSGYLHLLPKQNSPLAYGAIPVVGAGDDSPYDKDKVRAAKLLMSGRNLEADALLGQLMQKRVNDLDIHCLRATSAFYQRRFEECGDIVTRILRIKPLQPTALFLELCLQQTKNPDAPPLHDWHKSALIQTEMFVTWLDHSRVHLIRVMGAERFAQVCAIAIGPHSQNSLGPLADSLKNARQFYAKQDHSNSLVFYDLARRHGLSSEGLFLRTSECLFRLGRHEEALRRLDRLSQAFPENPHFWYNKGLVHMHLEQYPEAEPAFKKAWEKAPRNGMFGFAHACALVAQDRKDEAWPIIMQVARDFPGAFATWSEGEAPYLLAIRSDPRFPELQKRGEGKKP